MSTATVTGIRPVSCAIPVENLDDGERRRLLEWLAREGVYGLHPLPGAAVTVLAAAWASPSLTAAEAAAKWGDVVDEWDRWQAVESGEPDFRDVCPQMARADLDAAFTDLARGTSTYRGARQS
jgi:hypothetical protein